MKYILILSIFMGSALLGNAQAGSSGGNGRAQGGKTSTSLKSAAQLRGSGQYHGSKDTTPGSPMGTGGAGGSGMNGSPAGSASEAAIQQDKTDGQSTGQAVNQGTQAKKASSKRKNSQAKNRGM
jgi:hypothetical protein